MHDPKNLSIVMETLVFETVNTSNLRCELELRKSKRQRTEKSFGQDFLSTFIVERRDEIDCNFTNLFLIDEDPKTYQEALNSVESSMWKEAIKSELDSLVKNHTWDLVDLPMGNKPIRLRTPFDASKHLKKNKGDSVSQPGYAKIIGSVMYLINYTRPDIAYAVTDNDEVNSTSGYVFLLGGGPISWKSAKQTCIARSTMESEFIALELAEREAEWTKNLLGDVPLWGTSVPVSIQCDSQAAICTAKNSVYNGKSRHIRLRHAVVKQLLKE
ncbi:ty1-copia retrotransposon protein [Cucumis melo var. makuwa]|uniref:Ty1-copia retrotransposon protein n=1 Tax=Cucumis melo var. makuwa TaxID=1194695 RepID=A0A5A7VJT0_CUCMM|nr:ty1-copia retrotransposon protein [Cucumis melo var. makuwa]TYK30277.1 ty1-copia retrotransposon protein [Cucumis melo var. makuwa]